MLQWVSTGVPRPFHARDRALPSARLVRLTGWLVVSVLLGVQPARGQVVIMPGEIRENIAAPGQIRDETHGVFNDAEVTFDRPDAFSQNMRVLAESPGQLFPVFGTTRALGRLFVDFCVPAADAVSGCGSEPAVPDSLTASLTFGYGIVGNLTTAGVTSKASMVVNANVRDLAELRIIHSEPLLNETLNGIASVKTFKLIPIPIPGFEDAQITREITITMILRRGRVYRFELVAEGSTTLGAVQFRGTSLALVKFAGPAFLAPQNGFVQLRNLTISVSQDLSSVLDILKFLQDQIVRLGENIDRLRADHQEDITALRTELAELRLATLGPDPGGCGSQPPASGWVCVNGGWVPPDHPLAGGSGGGTPPPGPPPVCTGGAPVPGWVCVNGGWVPPDHPLARGGS